MRNSFLYLMISAALILTMSCAGTKKKEGEDAPAANSDGVEPAQPGSDISSQPMGFEAEGSDSGKIDGLVTVHFDLDKSDLSESARQDLANNANWIKSHKNTTVQIEGHCDNRGSVEYNLALGERRAKAVKNYLVNLGVEGKRLNIISYGKEKPIAKGESEEAFSKNRRANFVPLPQ